MVAKKLGRGLDALIRRTMESEGLTASPDVGESSARGDVLLSIDPRTVRVNRAQPRTRFDETAIAELSQSIKADGFLQPVIVRQAEDGQFELIAGERRLRAALQLDMQKIPAIQRELATDRLLEIALIENIQREDLNPMELARAFRDLKESNSWTQIELADRIGKKRSSVANTIRLLELPAEIQQGLEGGTITAGHAKILLSLPVDRRLSTYQDIVSTGLSVRDLELKLLSPIPAVTPTAASGQPPTASAAGEVRVKAPHVAEQEQQFSTRLGTKVEIREGRGKGRIIIEFYSTDDFERIRNLILAATGPR